MKNFQANLKRLEATDTQVLGVSMDSAFANHAFAEQIGVSFPLLAIGAEMSQRSMGSIPTNTKRHVA